VTFAFATTLESSAAEPALLHVPFTAFAVVHVGVILGGIGGFLRSATTGLPSAPQLTFSLPVARARIWVAWLAIAWTAGGALLGVALVCHAAVLLMSGDAVPFAAMTRTSLVAVAGMGSLLGLLGTLTLVSGNMANGAPFLIWLLLWWAQWERVVSFLADAERPAAVSIASLLVVTGLAGGCARLMLARKEF
jgi:hypothetical protein